MIDDDDFTHSDVMSECTLCESGVYQYVQVHYEKTGVVIYCRRCWIEICGGKPNDK
jgi:hypothetical protein